VKSIKLSYDEMVSLLSGNSIQFALDEPEYYAVDDYTCIGVLKKNNDSYVLEPYDKPSIVKVRTYHRELDTKYIPDLEVKKLNDLELEFMHSYAHTMSKHTGYKGFCKLHFTLANEMFQRGFYHGGNEPCDRVVEVIKTWMDNYIIKIPSYSTKALEYDRVIVDNWEYLITSGQELYKRFNGETKRIELSDCVKVKSTIDDEFKKRGIVFTV